jgi:hypothetical protein
MKTVEKVSYIVLKDTVVVNLKSHNEFGRTFTMRKDEDDYLTLMHLLKEEEYSKVVSMFDMEAIFKHYTDTSFVFQDGCVFYEGERIDTYLEQRIIEFAKNDLPYEHLANFWHRVRKNPSKNSVHQLYRFLEAAQCPITKDGTFIAYKSVILREDGVMLAHHDRKTEYRIGVPTSMERSDVVEDPSHACGPGLHVGSYRYAKDFGDSNSAILEVEVDPADVVSVPTDCSSGKCRCSCYIPRAYLVKEYNSPVVVDEQHKVLDGYDMEQIDEAVFNAINNQKLFPGKLKPQIMFDKLPTVIADIGAVEAAYKDSDVDIYYVKYMIDGKVECYVFSPEKTDDNTAANEDELDELEQPVPIVQITKEEVCEVGEAHPCIFKDIKYRREDMSVSTFKEITGKDYVAKVRLSKIPTMLKGQDVSMCFRHDDVTGSTVFYVMIGDNAYMYMPV